MAKTCNEEEGWLDNKFHLRWKYMWNKLYINATGCLNTILGPQSCDICGFFYLERSGLPHLLLPKRWNLKAYLLVRCFVVQIFKGSFRIHTLLLCFSGLQDRRHWGPSTWYVSVTSPLIKHRLYLNPNIYPCDTVISDMQLIFITRKWSLFWFWNEIHRYQYTENVWS
jgi:hypothetical protein